MPERILITAQTREDLELFKLQEANEPATKAKREGMAASEAGDNEAALRHFSRAIDLFGKESPTAVPISGVAMCSSA